MSSSSAVYGGQHDTKYVTFELLLHAAFVADEIWVFVLEPARTYLVSYESEKNREIWKTKIARKKIRKIRKFRIKHCWNGAIVEDARTRTTKSKNTTV